MKNFANNFQVFKRKYWKRYANKTLSAYSSMDNMPYAAVPKTGF